MLFVDRFLRVARFRVRFFREWRRPQGLLTTLAGQVCEQLPRSVGREELLVRRLKLRSE